MKDIPSPTSSLRRKHLRPGLPGLSLLLLSFFGWLILIANMFGFAGLTGWIFPVVTDIAGLAISTLLLAVIGALPLALRSLIHGSRKDSRA